MASLPSLPQSRGLHPVYCGTGLRAVPFHAVPVSGRHHDYYYWWNHCSICAGFHHHSNDPSIRFVTIMGNTRLPRSQATSTLKQMGLKYKAAVGRCPSLCPNKLWGFEENAQCCKVANDNVIQPSETCSSQDSSTTTSALPPTWTSSTSVSQKQKRKTGAKPSAEPQSEAVTNVESPSVNRNNSTALQLAKIGLPILRGLHLKSTFKAKVSFSLCLLREPEQDTGTPEWRIKGIQLL